MKAKHPGGRPTSYRAEFCKRVVALMDEGRSLLGVHPDSLYEWQKFHPEFSEPVRAGRAAATAFWKNRLLGRGQRRIWERPGHPMGAEERISRAASGWHNDAQRLEHPDGAPVAIEASAQPAKLDLSVLSWEERDALKAILLKCKGCKGAAEDQGKDWRGEP
jgi:hypothetical protein